MDLPLNVRNSITANYEAVLDDHKATRSSNNLTGLGNLGMTLTVQMVK